MSYLYYSIYKPYQRLIKGFAHTQVRSLFPYHPYFWWNCNPTRSKINQVNDQQTSDDYWHRILARPGSWIRVCGWTCLPRGRPNMRICVLCPLYPHPPISPQCFIKQQKYEIKSKNGLNLCVVLIIKYSIHERQKLM